MARTIKKPSSPEQERMDNLEGKKRASFDVDLSRFQKIKTKEKIIFTKNLQVMLKAGLSISSAMNTLTAQTDNLRFKRVIAQIHSDIEKGTTFATALKKHQKIFGDLYISMIESGELSGTLEDTLDYLQLQMKKDSELVAKVRGAMIYPSIVVVAMVGIGIAMMVFVIPKLVGIFDELKAELPAPTKVLISISNFLTNNGLLSVVIAIAVIAGIKIVYSTGPGKRFFHLLFLKAPILGPIAHKINVARMSRTLSSLIKTDLPIMKSLSITSETLGNVHYKKAMEDTIEQVQKGIPIAEAIQKYPNLFPPMVVQMIIVGEQSGQVDEVLGEVAHFYEEEIDQTMSDLPQIIEPLLILVLGAGVGAMAVAIIMPLYSLSESI